MSIRTWALYQFSKVYMMVKGILYARRNPGGMQEIRMEVETCPNCDEETPDLCIEHKVMMAQAVGIDVPEEKLREAAESNHE